MSQLGQQLQQRMNGSSNSKKRRSDHGHNQARLSVAGGGAGGERSLRPRIEEVSEADDHEQGEGHGSQRSEEIATVTVSAVSSVAAAHIAAAVKLYQNRVVQGTKYGYMSQIKTMCIYLYSLKHVHNDPVMDKDYVVVRGEGANMELELLIPMPDMRTYASFREWVPVNLQETCVTACREHVIICMDFSSLVLEFDGQAD